MPEQNSQRGTAITRAPFTAPFENHPLRFGLGGLNLKDALDVLEGWARHTNADHDQNGQVTSRPGLTALATGGIRHHSVRKLRDPQTGVDVRVWGIDTNLYVGANGPLALVDGGYSGDPLTLAPHRPPLSGDPWMFVADRNRMRKVRADGLDLPIGLPAPGTAATVALDREFSRSVTSFDTGDGTNAATWIATGGHDKDGNAAAAGSAADIPGPIAGTGCYFTTSVGAATSAYDSWWGHALTRDLTRLDPVGGPPGSVPASDDDVMHIWMLTSHPWLVEEVRIYVVVSPSFDPTVLPGTDTTGTNLNIDAYVKGFRQDDFVQFIQALQTQIDAAETARIFALRDQDLIARGIVDDRNSWAVERAGQDPQRARSLQIGTGGNQWFGIGQIGSSFRRGDFKRIGSTPGADWSTVTGVIVYIKHSITPTDQIVALGLDDMYLFGGFGPDTVEPGAQQYDYRYTHYDPRTGAEGNGSPEMAVANRIDSIRRRIIVSPDASGDGAVRQRVYRRGGSVTNDWFFCGTNSADGGDFTDDNADEATVAAGSLPTDHFQAVPTINDAGATVLAQPLPAIWGPLEGMLLACGDPHRPGHLYWSNADAPDHWSASGNVEVCPPSEALQHGGLLGHQGFVFSTQRLYTTYPNLTGGQGVTAVPSLCKRGLSLSRWAFAVGPGGIYFAAEDGFFRTTGGPEEWIGREIQPLFEDQSLEGLFPINKAAPTAISVTVWENKVYFTYQDTLGGIQTLVYAILHKFWRHYSWGRQPARLQGEDEATLLVGGATSGTSYSHQGFNDDGVAITATIRSGAQSGGTREEKLFGDQILDADRQGVAITVQNFLNEEAVVNNFQTLSAGSGRQRYVLDAFGDAPQKGHSISTQVSWASATAAPILYQLVTAVTLQPDLTSNRVTNWDDLGSPDEVWLTGITLDVDTNGVPRTIVIERDYAGVRDVVATIIVNSNNRHKLTYSWPAVPARQVRIRPTDDCKFWILYRADWIFQQEPPRISKWNIHFENQWDQYHTGLDLHCDTGGLEKRVRVSVDNVFLVNTLAGNLSYWPVIANGRKVIHLTLPWGRGHVYHFEAIDDNPGLLYAHRWHLDPEPSEQANWNQNFTVLGSRADKWLKAVIFECDTYGANKAVEIQADGVTVETLTIAATGRSVVQRALTDQRLGRVWRMFPVDGNPGRLYSAQPVFDEEPFQLDRWETQETNHGLPGWFYPLYGHLTLKSTQEVTLTTIMSANQTGRLVTEVYTVPPTGGVKQRRFLNGFRAGKGVLIKYILTSAEPFWLYRDETVLQIQPWGAAQPIAVHPFGNDDMDASRPMTNAVFAAQASGGAADD